MKIISIIILTFSLTACGKGSSLTDPTIPTLNNLTPTSLSVDAQITPYYTSFVSDANSQNYTLPTVGLTLKLDSTLSNSTVSTCTPGTSTTSAEVSINTTYWNQLSSNNKENMVFHELGSCYLGRANRTDLNNGIPLSVMNPSLISTAAYSANHAQYVYELFNQADLVSSLPLVN
jgi:hypothetical protein